MLIPCSRRRLAQMLPLPRKRKLQHLLQRQRAPVLRRESAPAPAARGARTGSGHCRPRAGVDTRGAARHTSHNRSASLPPRRQNCFKLSPLRRQLGIARPRVQKIRRRLVQAAAACASSTSSKSTLAAASRPAPRSARPQSSPSRTRNSRLMRYGFPANADEPAYGELP